MYKLCKTEQSANRQRELEQGLMEAMLNHHYEQISVSDLCDRMDIPRKAFYRYFSGKDGALHALIDHTLMDFENSQWDRFWAGSRPYHQELERFFEFWIVKKPLLDALQRSDLSGVLIERTINQALSEVGISGAYSSRNEPDLNVHSTMFCVTGLMSMVVSWHHSGYPYTPRQMAQIAFRLVTEPLFRQ